MVDQDDPPMLARTSGETTSFLHLDVHGFEVRMKRQRRQQPQDVKRLQNSAPAGAESVKDLLQQLIQQQQLMRTKMEEKYQQLAAGMVQKYEDFTAGMVRKYEDFAVGLLKNYQESVGLVDRDDPPMLAWTSGKTTTLLHQDVHGFKVCMKRQRQQPEDVKRMQNSAPAGADSVEDLLQQLICEQQLMRTEMEEKYQQFAAGMVQRYEDFAAGMVQKYEDFAAGLLKNYQEFVGLVDQDDSTMLAWTSGKTRTLLHQDVHGFEVRMKRQRRQQPQDVKRVQNLAPVGADSIKDLLQQLIREQQLTQTEMEEKYQQFVAGMAQKYGDFATGLLKNYQEVIGLGNPKTCRCRNSSCRGPN